MLRKILIISAIEITGNIINKILNDKNTHIKGATWLKYFN